MAQKGVQLDRETFSCSICLDLLKDPVTVPCGHSYCMNCIKRFWDGKKKKNIYSCPQCRQTFTPRPVLLKNTMLADLVEELKKTGLQAAPADHCYAGPEDVACDVCTGRKLKACKSCLQCLISYCEKHLQPHYDSPAFKKHKLVEPSKKLQENVCSRHDEVMKMFCRTDQQSICYLCSVDEHKGHDTVSAAAERTERQRELGVSRQNIQQRIQDREKDVNMLQQQVEAINYSADKTVEDREKISNQLFSLMKKGRSAGGAMGVSEKIFNQLMDFMQIGHSHEKQQLRYQQEAEVSRVRELQEKLDESTDSFSINIHVYPVTEVDVLLPQPEPKTRAEFLQYSCDITLDPNTAHTLLLLSDGNRKATFMSKGQSDSSHPDRFTGWDQVLSRESLTGRCYWEVKRRGRGVHVAVAYKNISRAGNECGFGCNDKSWVLDCDNNSYNFWYRNMNTPVSGPRSSRVGVYLDHRAGILSFYSISKTMTLLHRVQTTFTQPLYAGLGFCNYGDTVELCKVK
uniref:E3 ubiquitin/ISG15 ligase TRIM25-like n=1 Tax=Semicossyphus pulcher TaxID=241346 RepID=UPI0037E8381B